MRALLVHGLGRTPLSMAWLARRLRQAGHRVSSFGYLPTVESYDRIRGRLAGRTRALDETGEPWTAIGHSLGGLLLRDALGETHPTGLHHLFLLGTPNQLPRLGPRAARVAPFRWMTGECGRKLADPTYFAALPIPPVPTTIIAGTRGPRGRWSPFGDAPNDGVVAVDETRLDAAAAMETFPVLHTFMMNDAAIGGMILSRLAVPTG